MRLFLKPIGPSLVFLLAFATVHPQDNGRASKNSRRAVLTGREIAQRTFPSVVVLIAADSQGNSVALGSGFFVADGVIATNHHVFKDASRVYIKMIGPPGESLIDRLLREKEQGVHHVARIIDFDEEHDLALLRVEGIKARPLVFAKTRLGAVGDAVYVAGNPEGLEGTFSQGIISALRDRKVIQITAAISHGSSGSPVLNNRGEVIGIAVGAVNEGQNLNFAVPIAYVISLINRRQY